MKSSPRSVRMASQVESLISPLISRFLDPDIIGFCTVTAVEVSGDLQVADVYVRSINPPGGWLKALKKVSGKIGHEIGQELNLNQKLLVRFKEDQAVKLVAKLEKHGL